MHMRIMTLLVPMLLIAVGVSPVFGQEQTERYIPIGKSPGISGKYSYIGKITGVDAANHTISVRDDTGSRTINCPHGTRIWLDRSALKQTNITGSFADMQVGRTVEVKFRDYQRMDEADWIKVGVGAAGG